MNSTANRAAAHPVIPSTTPAPAADGIATPSRLLTLRRRIGGALLARGFTSAAELAGRLPLANPDRHDVDVDRDLAYLTSGLAEHTLDVWRPRHRDGPRPVVFYVHGGAFASLSKDTHWIMALGFARRGVTVVMPNYRLAPVHRFPAALEDLSEALRFTRANIEQWGGDPDNIVFAGESAGANLVTALTCALAYQRTEPYARVVRDTGIYPKAVIAACGVFQVTDGARFARDHGASWFFDDRYQELATGYAAHHGGVAVGHDLMDPLLLLQRERPLRPLPPFFLPVGSRDHLKADHARMFEALLAHGTDAQAPVYEGEVHAFHAFVHRQNARRCWDDQAQFLHQRGVAIDLVARKKIGWGLD